MNEHPTIVLLQARRPDDRARVHEQRCFAQRTGLPAECFSPVNMAVEPLEPALLDGADAVFVGGAGHFSVVEGNFDWLDGMLGLLEVTLEARIPMFASCFGFQAIVRLYGGQLVAEERYSEIGTRSVKLTEAGRRDPLFGQLPGSFDAQLGHKDSAVSVPDELQRLAGSDACPVQAFRIVDRPVVATQFHPELSYEANVERYVNYALEYKGIDDPMVAESNARAELRPTPEANTLLERFLREHTLKPAGGTDA